MKKDHPVKRLFVKNVKTVNNLHLRFLIQSK